MLNRIFWIKLVHSLIFWVMVASLGYILYCGITGTFNLLLAIAIGLILLEGLALLLNGWRCPLSTLAERFGAGKGSVTAIFLPDIIARNTFRISLIVFPTELVLLAIRYFLG